MVICVYGASSDTIHPDFLKAGEALGSAMARRGHSLVFGGGGHGLMGAVARGVASSGGSITGVAPRFFNVDGVLFDGCTEFVYTDTMRERKAIMEERADAFLMTPGGIGTFEEFFEILTLRQLGRHNKPISVLNTMAIMLASVILVPAAMFLVTRAAHRDYVPIYMGGVNEGDNTYFTNSFGQPEHLYLTNWYLRFEFGMRHLRRPSEILSAGVLVVMFCVIIGGAI